MPSSLGMGSKPLVSSSTLSVAGDTRLNSLLVSSNLIQADAPVLVNGYINIVGAMASSLLYTGAASVNTTLSVGGAVQVDSTLNVTSDFTVGGICRINNDIYSLGYVNCNILRATNVATTGGTTTGTLAVAGAASTGALTSASIIATGTISASSITCNTLSVEPLLRRLPAIYRIFSTTTQTSTTSGASCFKGSSVTVLQNTYPGAVTLNNTNGTFTFGFPCIASITFDSKVSGLPSGTSRQTWVVLTPSQTETSPTGRNDTFISVNPPSCASTTLTRFFAAGNTFQLVNWAPTTSWTFDPLCTLTVTIQWVDQTSGL